MSNLGAYQDIVTVAKKAGGVTKLIATIEKNAVNSAKPSLYAKGGAVGALATAVLGLAGKWYYDKRKVEQETAAEAKRQLTAELDQADINGPEIGSDD